MDLVLQACGGIVLAASLIILCKQQAGWSTNLSLMLLSLVVASTLCELALRRCPPDWMRHKSADDQIGARIRMINEQYAQHNPYGFNDVAEYSQKPAGRTRLAVVGDSFVWGWGLEKQDQRWSTRLEKALNAESAEFEVLHLGYPSWSTYQQVNFLEKYGKALEIDHILIGFIYDDLIPFQNRRIAIDAVANQVAVFFPNLAQLIADGSHRLLARYRLAKSLDEESLKQYRALLARLGTITRQNKQDVMVVMLPVHNAIIEERIFDKAKQLIMAESFDVYDLREQLSPILASTAPDKLYLSPSDHHPSPFLHDLYAREVFNSLAGKRAAWAN